MAFPSRDRRTAPAAHRREGHSGSAGKAPLSDLGAPQRSRRTAPDHDPIRQARLSLATPIRPNGNTLFSVSGDAEAISLSSERRELLCSVIGLAVKLGLVAVAGVSLFRLAGAYQQRMERQGEISAVLELQTARLNKARARFEELFMTDGEQLLIREQSQWIAPNRMRVVFQNPSSSSRVDTASASPAAEGSAESRRSPRR